MWLPWCSLLDLLGYLTCQTGTSDSAVLRMIAKSWSLSAAGLLCVGCSVAGKADTAQAGERKRKTGR